MGYHFTKLVPSLWNMFKKWQRENIICKEKLKHSMYVHLFVCIFELLVIQASPFAMNTNEAKSHFFFNQVINCIGVFLVETSPEPEKPQS